MHGFQFCAIGIEWVCQKHTDQFIVHSEKYHPQQTNLTQWVKTDTLHRKNLSLYLVKKETYMTWLSWLVWALLPSQAHQTQFGLKCLAVQQRATLPPLMFYVQCRWCDCSSFQSVGLWWSKNSRLFQILRGSVWDFRAGNKSSRLNLSRYLGPLS